MSRGAVSSSGNSMPSLWFFEGRGDFGVFLAKELMAEPIGRLAFFGAIIDASAAGAERCGFRGANHAVSRGVGRTLIFL